MKAPSDTDPCSDSPAVNAVAGAEGIDPVLLSKHMAEGSAVIMRRNNRFVGIGRGLRIKVNVNIGTSDARCHPDEEVRKAVVAERHGADTISDLSMGGDIGEIRQLIFAHTTVPITTVPVYQAAAELGIGEMTAGDILAMVREQAREGVSSMVIHCITPSILEQCRKERRVLGIVSKGGSITASFMLHHGCQNPFIEHFQELLGIMRTHGIVLSLGNSVRGGCIGDAWDAAQQEELETNVTLARVAQRAGVQVIIEGAGGHIRYDRIAPVIRRFKEVSPFPLFVAGPLPTDIALGLDHIAGCVGASAAGAAGADYLCCITPAEHLGLPSAGQVRDGLIAWRIAAHIGDLVRLRSDAKDREMARRRARMDRKGQIEIAIDPDAAKEGEVGEGPCSMCGDFCALRLMRAYLEGNRQRYEE